MERSRLTRRTATVTISAPEASMAAAVSGPSLYLPVPTMRRERKRRPAMTRSSVVVELGGVEDGVAHRFILGCTRVREAAGTTRRARLDRGEPLCGELLRLT